MEGVASAFAVVSLALQLAESVKKLYEFWDSVVEAPRHIQATTTDLKVLQSILCCIADDAQHTQPDELLTNVLQSCNGKVASLLRILGEIDPGFASSKLHTRKWTAIKTVRMSAKLQKFQDTVEKLKVSLLLAQQTHYGRLNRIQHSANQQSLAEITECVSRIDLQRSMKIENQACIPPVIEKSHFQTLHAEASEKDGAGNNPVYPRATITGSSVIGQAIDVLPIKAMNEYAHTSKSRIQAKETLARHEAVVEYLFGTIHIKSKQSRIQVGELDDMREWENTVSIRPAGWLVNLGFKYGLKLNLFQSSIQGWKQTLSTSCHVPDDALVFEFCKQGNLDGVRSLLSRGDASIRDVDSGAGLLFSLLLEAGAESTARDYYDDHILEMTMVNLPEVVDTLRIFSDDLDFSDVAAKGWGFLEDIGDETACLNGDMAAKRALFSWILHYTGSSVRENFLESKYWQILYWVLSLRDDDIVRLFLQCGRKDAINSRDESGGYSGIHYRAAQTDDDLEIILKHFPDLHLSGLNPQASPVLETPTSIAMYSSPAFVNWRHDLYSTGIDMYAFINEEIQRKPLSEAGWTPETLTILFNFNVDPATRPEHYMYCPDCLMRWEDKVIIVQPFWMHILTKIMSGLYDQALLECEMEGSWIENEDESESEDGRIESNEESRGGKGNVNSEPLPSGSVEDDFRDSSSTQASANDIPKSSGEYGGQDGTAYSFDREEMICVDCWIRYRDTGQRIRVAHPDHAALNQYFHQQHFDDESNI
ncbi:uncharacterized protein KY384_001785 [Bacidia gigantensis]|uniref:uncharacterized protein n=1 Tax=Bacidia gigantensis TaxID=2732470 RepID=UPI001D0407DB|nr:uncharacterized protein KY384_001785 [Bacidia gigantensis]KAG8533003.1 hypothetical protein KY384_001785 [Bacidia gigantensis]